MGTYMENLAKTIRDTGFPLELEIDDVMRSRGWATFPSHYYVDDEDGKQREIDNLALFPDMEVLANALNPLGLSPHLTLECKKLDEISAVIFCKDRGFVSSLDYSGQMYNFPQLIENRPRSKPENFRLDFFFGTKVQLHYGPFNRRIGVAEGIKPENEKSSSESDGRSRRRVRPENLIHTGLMQLVKAQAYDVARSIDRDKTIVNPYYPMYFGFLALVVEGRIVEVQRKKREFLLKEVDQGVAKVSYKPKYSDEMLNYLIDVVHKQHFGTYLDLLRNDAAMLVNAARSEKKALVDYMRRGNPA